MVSAMLKGFNIWQLTLHHDVLARPEHTVAAELLTVDSRDVLPVLPGRPVLTEVVRVPEHVGAEGTVSESVLAIAVAEGVVVVVRLGEYHHVLRGTLAE